MATTETGNGHEHVSTNQVSSAGVAGAVTEGTDTESMEKQPDASPDVGEIDHRFADEKNMQTEEAQCEEKETNAIQPDESESLSQDSETVENFEGDSQSTATYETEEKIEEALEEKEKNAVLQDKDTEESLGGSTVDDEMHMSTTSDPEKDANNIDENMDTDTKEADSTHQEKTGCKVSTADDLDEMMDIGTVDEMEQEAQMKDEDTSGWADTEGSSSPAVSNPVQAAEEENDTIKEETDDKPPSFDLMQSNSSSSPETTTNTGEDRSSPPSKLNGTKAAKPSQPRPEPMRLRSSSRLAKLSSSPPVVQVKDEPVDEEYDQALISSSTASVKDEDTETCGQCISAPVGGNSSILLLPAPADWALRRRLALVNCGLREEKGDAHGEIKQRQKVQAACAGGAAVRSVAIAKDRGDVEQNAGVHGNRSNGLTVSIVEPFGATPEPDSGSSSDSDDSEPDPDSTDEWLPSGSSSSRDSSPHQRGSSRAGRDRHSGSPEPGWSGFPSLTARTNSKVPESARGGASSSRHGGTECAWHQDNWQPQKFPFAASPGPQNAAAELESDLPVDFLELILTDELLQHIADQTNLYADQFFQAHPDTLPLGRKNVWKPVSVPELKTFFGLTFLTGYIKKPKLELYWSVDEVEATPYFSQTMPRNRFQLIWRFLHYNNNASHDTTDKMYKVRPVLDYIVGKFKELYQPYENICIDEGMMQWHGCLSFKVYNPQNPIKYGIKSYILCDSSTGYCFNMQPYVGQSSSLPHTVFSLLDRLSGNGYTLYIDNYCNSVALCEQLVKAKTNVCGPLTENRGEPQIIREVTKADLGVEGKLARHNGTVLVVAWQDKRLVKMVTTCHHDAMQRVEVWQKGRKEKTGQLKPKCVVAYDECMNRVDKLNQDIAYYPFIWRSLNWPKKFVAYLFQVAMFNAFVLYKARNPGKCKTLLEFMKKVVRSWTAKRHVAVEEVGDVEVEMDQPAKRAPYNHDPISRLDGQMAKHQLEYLMPTSKNSRPARKCRVCVRRGLRRESKMWCKSCCVPLHPGECYMAYHTKQKYY